MAGLIHLVFQTAAVVLLFVVMWRARWDALRDADAPEPGRDASDESPANSFGSSRAETRNSGTGAVFKKIALVYHESPQAVPALTQAIELAKALGPEVHGVTVLELPPYAASVAAIDCTLAMTGSKTARSDAHCCTPTCAKPPCAKDGD